MPALALTDLGNVVRHGQVLPGGARARASSPSSAATCWITNDADRDKPYRALLLCQSRAGYLRLCELLSRAYRSNQHRGRAEIARTGSREAAPTG